MLKVYEIYPKPCGYRDDDRAFVAAENPQQARYLAWKTRQSKMSSCDYIGLRARRFKELDYLLDINDPQPQVEVIDKPQWLFDNETYEDTLDSVRRWWYANQ